MIKLKVEEKIRQITPSLLIITKSFSNFTYAYYTSSFFSNRLFVWETSTLTFIFIFRFSSRWNIRHCLRPDIYVTVVEEYWICKKSQIWSWNNAVAMTEKHVDGILLNWNYPVLIQEKQEFVHVQIHAIL